MRSEDTQKKADIIVMPYNYLISPSIRATLSINWSRTVVVFDEAHNLESSCESATSYDLSSEDISGCIEECDLVVEHLSDSLSRIFAESDLPSEDNVLRIKSFLLEFERSVDDMKIGSTHSGQYAYDLMSRHHVDFNTVDALLPEIDKIINVLKGIGRYRTQDTRLQKFRKLLSFLFKGESAEIARATTALHYKIYVEGTTSRKKSSSRCLKFWCFSPSVAFRDLLDLGVRSAILTSGTLAPLSITAKEFRQTFPIRLENPHIIRDHQVWCGALSKGVTSKIVNGSFKNRNTSAYKSEVGNTIANMARIVPDGLLVFFASYSMLQQCVTFWQNYQDGTIWNRILIHKHIVVEPRTGGANAFKETSEEYENALLESGGSKRRNGCLFLAVCRGKASEGIDFSDYRARAVVIVGIPYPPFKDPYVMGKRKYLDEIRSKSGMNEKRMHSTGEEWYATQAARAVNQAIGRVIRHKDDFGAIVLFDERFCSARQRSRLSSWLRPYYKTCKHFGEVVRVLFVS